MDLLVWTNRKR